MVQRLTALVREVTLLGILFHVQGPHLTITGAKGCRRPSRELSTIFEEPDR